VSGIDAALIGISRRDHLLVRVALLHLEGLRAPMGGTLGRPRLRYSGTIRGGGRRGMVRCAPSKGCMGTCASSPRT